MTAKEKTHGDGLAAVRAFVESDPLLSGFTLEMLAQAACFALGIFMVLFAAKGWVVTWM